MAEVPSLKLQPLLHLCIGLILGFVPIVGILLLLSARTDHGFTILQLVYMAFLSLMFIWCQYFNCALTEFVIAYSTQLWCMLEAEGLQRPVCSAYAAAIGYHLGTLVLGALSCTKSRIAFMETAL